MKQETPLQKLIAEYEEYIKIAELEIEEAKKVNSSLMKARAEGQITAYKVCIAIAYSNLPYEREVIENAFDEGKNEGSTTAGNFEWGIKHKEIKASDYFNDTFKTE